MHKKNKSAGLEKTSTGIPGFDQLTGGGLPSRRTSLLLGGAGSGKTVFALQTLVAAARRGERGLFVSFSESPRQLLQNTTGFGWELEELAKEHLVFLDPRVRSAGGQAADYDLAGMLAGLQVVVREMGATLVVLDGLDILLSFLNEPRAELQELFRLQEWLGENGLTGLITASLEAGAPQAAQRRGWLQAMADCSVDLEFRVVEHIGLRHLRVVKYRGASCPGNELPFRIGPTGLELLAPDSPERPRRAEAGAALQSEIEQARKEMTERVEALDRFLEMKQAELDFLLEKKSAPARPAGGVRSRAGSRLPGRGQAKSLPSGGTQSTGAARP